MIHRNTLLAIIHDFLAATAAWLFSYLFRFNFDVPAEHLRGVSGLIIWAVPLEVAIFWRLGLYRGVWRYASLPDLQRILLAALLSALGVALGVYMLQPDPVVPRSVMLLNPILLIVSMGGSRLTYRAWKERRLRAGSGQNRRPVLILGAGDAAVNLIKSLSSSADWHVVGLLDDNQTKQGRQIQGTPVLGRIDDLPIHSARLDVMQAIIAMPGATHAARRRALDICTAAGVTAMTVPSYNDIVSGRVTVSQLRKVELDDLLGRDPVQLDDAGLADWIGGKTVMITGAGGSIGAELCRQLARFGPRLLLLFEQNEFALYRMEQEFLVNYRGIRVACIIGDVKDTARLSAVIEQYRPEVLFHAAAYKHVPMMEEQNAWEAVRNNVLGTLCSARAAISGGVKKFVLVSTDKAVNPTNVMGASKRLAELVCQGVQTDTTRFVTVRFGNVLGSTGSVIPKFREQIDRGGPITVTHPAITRYFMSIPEAAQLVLQAGLMGAGGEVFVLDMGEPVKIVDLARDLIRLSGFQENEIGIEFTGLRPGEKLYEELLADSEQTLPTPHPKLRVAKSKELTEDQWIDLLSRWLAQAGQLSDREVRNKLKQLIPEYVPAANSEPESP